MLLLLTDSLLLISITLALGIITREGLSFVFRARISADILELFLLGLLTSSIYFNLVSFWLPVDYRSLLPLGLLGIAGMIVYKERFLDTWHSIRGHLRFFLSSTGRVITIVMGLTLLSYWLLPPSDLDSLYYHFQSIFWYEKYPVVPGLVNLSARLAFNPASFTIQSGYSFTNVTGQSLYPLNGAASLILFAWLLLRLLRSDKSALSLVYAALIIFSYRALLINLPSPSSDGLTIVCMVYIMVSVAERCLAGNRSLSGNLVPVLVTLFAVTVKLGTVALLPVIALLFYRLPAAERTIGLVLKTGVAGLVIFLPWIVRNYILSGYGVFPLAFTDWFHPDWAAPRDVAIMEYRLFHLGPRVDDWYGKATYRQLHDWMINWIMLSLKSRTMDILLLGLALITPLYWLIRRRRKNSPSPLFLLWAIGYAGTWFWLESAPAIRYGRVYIFMTLLLPVFDLLGSPGNGFSFPANHLARFVPFPADRLSRFVPRLTLVAMVLSGTFYLAKSTTRRFAYPFTYPFSLAHSWLLPPKSIWHDEKQKKDFPYVTMKNGVRLYKAVDSFHCINACQPCMEFSYYGEVEMRGSRLEDGFRNVKDEARANFPAYFE